MSLIEIRDIEYSYISEAYKDLNIVLHLNEMFKTFLLEDKNILYNMLYLALSGYLKYGTLPFKEYIHIIDFPNANFNLLKVKEYIDEKDTYKVKLSNIKYYCKLFIEDFKRHFPNTYKKRYIKSNITFIERLNHYYDNIYYSLINDHVFINYNSNVDQYDVDEIKSFYKNFIDNFVDKLVNVKVKVNDYMCKMIISKLLNNFELFNIKYVDYIDVYTTDIIFEKDHLDRNKRFNLHILSKEFFYNLLLEKDDNKIKEEFKDNFMSVYKDLIYEFKFYLLLNNVLPNYRLFWFFYNMKFLYVKYNDNNSIKKQDLFIYNNLSSYFIKLDENEGLTSKILRKAFNIDNLKPINIDPIQYKDSIDNFIDEFNYYSSIYINSTNNLYKILRYYPNTDSIKFEKDIINEY